MSLPLPYKPTGAQSQTTGASFETECSVITADTSTYIMTMTNIQAIPMSGNSTILHLITRKSDLANRGDRGLIDTSQQQTTTGSKKCGANCSLLQLAALTSAGCADIFCFSHHPHDQTSQQSLHAQLQLCPRQLPSAWQTSK